MGRIGGWINGLIAIACAAASATPALAVDQAPVVAIGGSVSAPAGWSIEAARQLAGIIQGAGAEGLDPGDYHQAALGSAIADGEGPELDAIADAAALALAHDYLLGRVNDRGTMGWMIERSPYEAARLPQMLQAARAAGALDDFYRSLLPGDARYTALRAALAETTDATARDRLRVNMERARWMPRAVAPDFVYVNVPSYRLQVINQGVATSTYTVVVGAPETPTPQLISPATSLVVNPWWNVPPSIVRTSNLRPGRPGFQFTSAGDGTWAVRQPPGPRNALGRIKVNLVNDQAIYLHDTPAKSGFTRADRALSHGCVRVKDIGRLAGDLMRAGGDDASLEEALAGNGTATLRLPHDWPVYIVYFTADLDETGGVVTYRDPYGYDARVLAALDGGPIVVASR